MNLNDQQIKAINDLDNSLLIIAGAGTGKTTVLTERVSNILNTKRARADEIMMVTFTNKAAGEIVTRVKKKVGEQADQIWAGSFHSISLQIIKSHATDLGLANEKFTILDDSEQINIINEMITIAAGGKRVFSKKLATKVHTMIMGWKEDVAFPDDVAHMANDTSIVSGMAAAVYPLYQSALRHRNCVDYADLLLHVIALFKKEPLHQEFWAGKFKYILVDELQDANRLQYEWIKSITNDETNLCGVGDPRQAIYEWRGAKPELMAHFGRDRKSFKEIPITVNYRCTNQIVGVGNSVIRGAAAVNENAKLEALRDGPDVQINQFPTDVDEANFIGDAIEARLQGEPQFRGSGRIAVLVRTSAQMPIITQALRRRGIGIVTMGGAKLKDDKAIQDIIAYMRLATNPLDEQAYRHIIDRPNRNIGPQLAKAVWEKAFSEQVDIHDGIQMFLEEYDDLAPAKRTALREFGDLLEVLIKMSATDQRVDQLIETIIDETNYLSWYARFTTERELKESRSQIKRLIGYAKKSRDPISDFLTSVALSEDQYEGGEGDVVVSTMHSSKGLEFDTVFCPMMCEGITPHYRNLKGDEDPAEERRLVHVAWTRAEEHLYLSSPSVQNFRSQTMSRYLGETGLLLTSEARMAG